MEVPYFKHIAQALPETIVQKVVTHADNATWAKAKIQGEEGAQKLDLSVRRGERTFIRDEQLIADIYKAIQKDVPQSLVDGQLVGPNSQMTLLWYSAGDYFKMHYDGDYMNEKGQEALITVQMYIDASDDLIGGGTTFFHDDAETIYKAVPCRVGDAVIFHHDWLHQGDLVQRGEKMALRLDIMYEVQ